MKLKRGQHPPRTDLADVHEAVGISLADSKVLPVGGEGTGPELPLKGSQDVKKGAGFHTPYPCSAASRDGCDLEAVWGGANPLHTVRMATQLQQGLVM
jgi:hypothetical protein